MSYTVDRILETSCRIYYRSYGRIVTVHVRHSAVNDIKSSFNGREWTTILSRPPTITPFLHKRFTLNMLELLKTQVSTELANSKFVWLLHGSIVWMRSAQND